MARGKASAGARLKARFTPGRIVRLIIQVAFFVFAPQVFSMAFSGARYILVCFGKAEAIAPTGFVVLLVILCVYTLVLGRFFCGYACAFGTLGDVIYEAVNALCAVLGIERKRLRPAVAGKLRYTKFAVLAGMLIASFLGASSFIGMTSPWTAFGRVTNLQFASLNVVGLVILVLIVVGMAWQERFFCQYLCPLGALFALVPQVPLFTFKRNIDACINCAKCQKRCPVEIYPPGESLEGGECIACGQCAEVCPCACVEQRTGTQTGGNRLVVVIAVAVLLLVLFWLVGAVNIIPTLG